MDDFVHQGFKGIKFINPKANYDDPSFMPVYECIAKHRIPAIFHTGIFSRTPSDREMDVNNGRHRPVYLDTIARYFPEGTFIGARLGNQWHEEAAMACRWNPNTMNKVTPAAVSVSRRRMSSQNVSFYRFGFLPPLPIVLVFGLPAILLLRQLFSWFYPCCLCQGRIIGGAWLERQFDSLPL